MSTRRMARPGVAVIVAACSLPVATAGAGVYSTVYTLNTPYTVTSPEVTQVLVNWSTNATGGLVDQADLTDWSISFLGGETLVYTDTIIVGGAVQSIGGISRGIADILFNFDLDTLVAGDFDNMLQGSLLAGTSGTVYNVYSYPQGPFEPPYSTLGIWANGNEATRELPGYSSVTTVPAPGAFAVAALAGLCRRRRRG